MSASRVAMSNRLAAQQGRNNLRQDMTGAQTVRPMDVGVGRDIQNNAYDWAENQRRSRLSAASAQSLQNAQASQDDYGALLGGLENFSGQQQTIQRRIQQDLLGSLPQGGPLIGGSPEEQALAQRMSGVSSRMNQNLARSAAGDLSRQEVARNAQNLFSQIFDDAGDRSRQFQGQRGLDAAQTNEDNFNVQGPASIGELLRQLGMGRASGNVQRGIGARNREQTLLQYGRQIALEEEEMRQQRLQRQIELQDQQMRDRAMMQALQGLGVF